MYLLVQSLVGQAVSEKYVVLPCGSQDDFPFILSAKNHIANQIIIVNQSFINFKKEILQLIQK